MLWSVVDVTPPPCGFEPEHLEVHWNHDDMKVKQLAIVPVVLKVRRFHKAWSRAAKHPPPVVWVESHLIHNQHPNAPPQG